MSDLKVFFNKRKGDERRSDKDPCRNLPLDLFHRKRRKTSERRASSRSLDQDYTAYLGALLDIPPEVGH